MEIITLALHQPCTNPADRPYLKQAEKVVSVHKISHHPDVAPHQCIRQGRVVDLRLENEPALLTIGVLVALDPGVTAVSTVIQFSHRESLQAL